MIDLYSVMDEGVTSLTLSPLAAKRACAKKEEVMCIWVTYEQGYQGDMWEPLILMKNLGLPYKSK
jgi:hypothetical protein